MAFPKMVHPGKREAGWRGLSADGRGTAGALSPHVMDTHIKGLGGNPGQS